MVGTEYYIFRIQLFELGYRGVILRCKIIQSNLFNTDNKGAEPSVRFTEVSVL